MPKIFRLTKGGKLIEGIFEGETINTPRCCASRITSCALDWAKSVGGLKGLIDRADANAAAVADSWPNVTGSTFLAVDPATAPTPRSA